MRAHIKRVTSGRDEWPSFFYLLIWCCILLMVILLKELPGQRQLMRIVQPVSGIETLYRIESDVVSYVYDGDTVELANGSVVRFIGIDTPELNDNSDPICFAKEAYLKTKQLLLDKKVTLEKDVSDKDRYGRLLRYIWVDGIMVNELLVQEGYAKAEYYFPDGKYSERFRYLQDEAQINKKGLWGECLEAEYTEPPGQQNILNP